jgi:HlyD family secretion protein
MYHFYDKFVNIIAMKRVIYRQLIIFTVVVLTITIFFSCTGKKTSNISYEFTTIKRGTVERTVTSTGTINPVAAVKVLPRMSGKVEAVLVDYNDTVHKGDILARLNTDMLRLQRDQMAAAVQKARANYELQLTTYHSQEVLAQRNLISEYELRASKTSLDNLAADLAVSESNLRSKETEIYQYAYITSPITGIVLDRNVNVGDTVVDSSSNNSSSIFTIAENLRDMQIEATVGEIDVTSISKGQHVRFTLESMPGRRFSGVVDNLRMVPVVQNNVVNYTVIINVENRDGSLLPGMTCAVEFIVERAEHVLMVANSALRYQPTGLSEQQISELVFNASLANMNEEQRQAATEARAESAKAAEQGNQNQNSGITGLMMGQQQNTRMPGMGGTRQRDRQAGAQGQVRQQTIVMRNLWYFDEEGRIECMQVRAGISDGSSTQLYLDEEFEGKQVILREKI